MTRNISMINVIPRKNLHPDDFIRTKKLRAPSIVMNPPFKTKGFQSFVDHSINLGAELICSFGQLTILESIGRKEWLEQTGLTWVIVISDRPVMWYGNEEAPFKGMLAFAWYVWDFRKRLSKYPKIQFMLVADYEPGWEL